MNKELTGYDLSRIWFDFCFENPERIVPNHTAMYFFIIEHCNRLGWKKKFGLPTSMTMDAIGIKSYNTYKKTITDLVDWGFIKMLELSKNQYSSNIIALSKYDKALDKALDKAMMKHGTKQGESMEQSISSIDKPITLEPITIKPAEAEFNFSELLNPPKFPNWRDEVKEFLHDEYLIQQWVKEKGLPYATVVGFMREFVVGLNLAGDFKKCSAIKVHFRNHYEKHYGSKVPVGKNQGSLSNAFIEVPKDFDYEAHGDWGNPVK